MDSGIFKLHQRAQATLNTADIRESVKLPAGVNEDAWIAAQTVTVYNEVSQLVAVLEDICTEETCPTMCAGKHLTYKWSDNESAVPRTVPAPEYMYLLMGQAFTMLSDSSLIPQDGSPFPPHYRGSLRTLLRRLLRVYIHTYLVHFEDVCQYGAEAHVNCSFKHFLWFTREFDLVSQADFGPIHKLVERFRPSCTVTPKAEADSPAERPMRSQGHGESAVQPPGKVEVDESAVSSLAEELPEVAFAWKAHVGPQSLEQAAFTRGAVLPPPPFTGPTGRSDWLERLRQEALDLLSAVRGMLEIEAICTRFTCPGAKSGPFSSFYEARAPTSFAERLIASSQAPGRPPSEAEVKDLMTKCLRFYAHAYAAHFDRIERSRETQMVINSGLQHSLMAVRELGFTSEEWQTWPAPLGAMMSRLELDLLVEVPRLRGARKPTVH